MKRGWPNDPECKLCGSDHETPRSLKQHGRISSNGSIYQCLTRLIQMDRLIHTTGGSAGGVDKTQRRDLYGILIFYFLVEYLKGKE